MKSKQSARALSPKAVVIEEATKLAFDPNTGLLLVGGEVQGAQELLMAGQLSVAGTRRKRRAGSC